MLHSTYNRGQRAATILYTGEPAVCSHPPTRFSSAPQQPTLFLMHPICIPAGALLLNLRMSHNLEHAAAIYWAQPGMVLNTGRRVVPPFDTETKHSPTNALGRTAALAH